VEETAPPVGDRVVIGPDDPNAADVRRLLMKHLEFSYANSPAEAVFALDTSGLTKSDVSFFGARMDGRLLGVGALRHIDKRLAEIKSMHTDAADRGRGVGRRMLEHLISIARSTGYDRVNLETGSMDSYAPARAMYASAGFLPTGPFGGYPDSPYSCFMTLPLL
jgi:putative acetyltransferase